MADLQTLLDQIPEGEQYNLIRDSLVRINQTFPEDMAEINEARVTRFVEDVDSGARDDDRIRQDMFTYIVGAEKIQQELGVSPDQAAKLISGDEQFAQQGQLQRAGDLGSTENPDVATAPLTILRSPTLKWYKDPNTNRWYASYRLTNSDHEYVFEAEADQVVALFGEGDTPDGYESKTLQEITKHPKFTFGGNISEMEGQGSLEAEMQRVKSIALDSGMLPEWARNDPAAEDIAYIAMMEGKSEDWTVDEILKLPSAQTRFPGLDTLRKQGLTGSESVQAFLEFENGIKAAQRQLGKPVEAVTPEIVGGLIGKGYALSQVQDTFKQFKRMEDHAPALDAFNQVLAANGKQPLSSVKDKFDFLQGNAPQDVYDIYEASSFREAATQAGLGDIFSAGYAIDAALQTQGVTSLETATQGMQQAAQMLLRMRHEVDTGEFDLEQDDLVDLSLGLQPRSGKTQSELMQQVSRATSAARGFVDTQRAAPFRGFGQGGTPQAASLGNLRETT